MKISTAITAAALLAINAANAECKFIRIDKKSPAGQSLLEVTANRGASGYSRLPDEDGWIFEKKEFSKINVTAPHSDFLWLGTYKHLVFKSNLRYATNQLKPSRLNIEARLSACARRINADCWVDSYNNYYEVARDSKDTYLYITYPNFAAPDDPDLPPKNCSKSSQ